MYPGTHAKSSPDKAAYVFVDCDGEELSVSYRELDERSNQCARFYRSLGLGFESATAIFMENHPRFFDHAWGAMRSGLYSTPIASHLQADEVAYILQDCGARTLVTSYARREVARELLDRTPGVETYLMIDGTIPGYQSFEEALAAQSTAPIPDELEGAEMLYSSGTTGRPKGIRNPMPMRQIGDSPLIKSALAGGMFGANHDTVYLSPAPLYHAAPLRFTMTMLRLGATSIILERFDPELALKLIEKHHVTMSQWVPTMFVRILKLPEEVRRRYDTSSQEIAIHAAAPCPVQVKEALIDWWGPIVFEYYGGTEGNGATQIGSEDWLEHKGSVGRAVGCSLHIVDDHGLELGPGDIGTVYFEGGGSFEYHGDPEKTASGRSSKGWTTIGDVGYVDDAGYLYLTDRKAYTIVSGGVNIYPQESENLLITHPQVADAAVFGVPNEEFGEEVKAVVQLLDPSQASPELAQQLIAFCRRNLSKLKCPRSVDFETELPRGENGKLYKRELRDRYWADQGKRI